MIYEVEFQITPAMAKGLVSKALLDEPYNLDYHYNMAYTTGVIPVECDRLEEMRDKLRNLAEHIEQADTSKQYVIDFEFKVQMTF